MKILLTGGTGMVGSNIREYNDISRHVILSPSSWDLDLTDQESVGRFFDEHDDIDCVIHAAGKVGGIHANMNNRAEFLRDNTIMGFNLINCAQFHGIDKFINLATSCMYPMDAVSPISEDKIFDGKMHPTNEGYAVAKSAVAKYCEYVGGNYKTIIPCNIYGKYDKFDPEKSHMVPAAIQKIHKAKMTGEKVCIWGDGTAQREFMYAKDVADFIFYFLENIDDMPQYINLGLPNDHTINEYYEAVADVIGYKDGFEHNLDMPVGVKRKKTDTTKISELGWKHKYSLIDGIKETYEYYKEIV